MDLLFYFPVVTHLQANLSAEEFAEVNRVINSQRNDSNNRKISLKELYGLQWRLGEDEPRAFFPPGYSEQDSFSSDIMEAGRQLTNLEKKYNWKDSPWKKYEVNFSEFTNDNPIKMHLRDNPYDSSREYIFEVSVPITLEELIPKINAHQTRAGLVGEPDNGIFDLIKYENGIFEVYTAS